jgi:pimeloyl-ACP methyl ester carboxylesterase
MSETYVLINGAFLGGWAWRPVAKRLRAAGHRVIAPTLPGLADGDDPRKYSLADVADFLVALVEREDLNDVTLVAHSWGGYPMNAAAHGVVRRLKKLVYWSACVPVDGVSLHEDAHPDVRTMVAMLAEASGDNTVTFPYEAWRTSMIQDADEDVARLTYELLVPHPFQHFTTPVRPFDAAAAGIPVTYLLSEDDRSMPPGEWDWLPRCLDRLGVTPVRTPGSHLALLTRPAELAASILKA